MSNVFKGSSSRISKCFDLLRSPFSAEFDWKNRLEQSGLPANVQDVIRQVVKKSRLMRFEKTEVTDDLVAHFEDGASRGNSFTDLLRDFGSPQDTAILIRQSKIRNRSMLTKLGRVSAVLGLGVITTYIIALIVFNLGKPNPSMDYMSVFNAPIDVMPENEKAWNVYRDVWAGFEFCEGIGGRFEEIYHRSPEGSEEATRLVKPGDVEWDTAIAKLQDSQELLDSFRVGARLPFLGVSIQANRNKYSREDRLALHPNDDPDELIDPSLEVEFLGKEGNKIGAEMMVSALLPHIQSFRKAARILAVDSRWAQEQGDTERIVQNIETVMGLSRQAAECDFLVCGMVGIAVNGIGNDIVDDVMRDNLNLFDDSQLQRIQAAVQSADPMAMFDLRGERLSIKDIIQRVYTDDGHGDGRVTSVGLKLLTVFDALYAYNPDRGEESFFSLDAIFWNSSFAAPISMMFAPSRMELTSKLDELLDRVEAQFDDPYWKHDGFDGFEVLEEELSRYFILSSMFPVFEGVYLARERCLANRDGMLLMLAAKRFQLRHGQWLSSTGDWLGEYLDTIPVDRFTGQPLKMIVPSDAAGDILIYSVGPDGDDDAGRSIVVGENGSFPAQGVSAKEFAAGQQTKSLPAGEFNFALGKHIDGDWVIWPRNSGL